MSEFENQFFKSVYEFEELMKKTLELDIKLPSICLMGLTRSGKSLLLSSIIGQDILPIEQSLDIKRPLELKLYHLNEGEPYATLEDFKEEGLIISDFSLIKEHIQIIQKWKIKNYEEFSKPIILNIYSTKYPNMTFIDLPGMTYYPLGESPKNIIEAPTILSRNYANDDLNLLLCAIPANEKKLEEKMHCFRCIENFGESTYRILPVLTKVDLITESGDVVKDFKEFFENKIIPFKYGCVCAKNRSSENLKNNMNLKDAIEEEKKFFEKESPLYGKLPEDCVGYDALIKKLKKAYFEVIKKIIANKVKKMNQLIGDGEKLFSN